MSVTQSVKYGENNETTLSYSAYKVPWYTWPRWNFVAAISSLCKNANETDAKILTAFPLENWRRPPGCHRTMWIKQQCPVPEWSNWRGSESSTLETNVYVWAVHARDEWMNELVHGNPEWFAHQIVVLRCLHTTSKQFWQNNCMYYCKLWVIFAGECRLTISLV